MYSLIRMSVMRLHQKSVVVSLLAETLPSACIFIFFLLILNLFFNLFAISNT